MAELDITDRFKKFSLRWEEDNGISLESGDIRESTEDCNKSLIGKIYGNKVANLTGLKNIIPTMWLGCGPIRIIELGVNLFQFFFESQADRSRILTGKSWIFDSQFLILKPWSEGMNLKKEAFSKVQLWVQVWNLPFHWISKETGFKLKNLFGKVLDVLIPERRSKMGQYLRILVEIDLEKPLFRGTKVKFKDQMVWVSFQYETAATFCFYCGIVGHQEKHCDCREKDAVDNKVNEGQYGDWLRAAPIRKQKSGQHVMAAKMNNYLRKAVSIQGKQNDGESSLALQENILDGSHPSNTSVSEHEPISQSVGMEDNAAPLLHSTDTNIEIPPLQNQKSCDESRDETHLPQEISNNKGGNPEHTSPSIKKFRCKLKGKESRGNPVNSKQEIYAIQQGIKRNWKLLDEDETDQETERKLKKKRELEPFEELNINEVVMTSLNWAQKHQ